MAVSRPGLGNGDWWAKGSLAANGSCQVVMGAAVKLAKLPSCKRRKGLPP